MMKSILEKFDLLEEQSGAGIGSMLETSGQVLQSISPIDGQVIGTVRCANRHDYERVITQATEAFKVWRMTPAPKRGDIVRQIAAALRENKKDLGAMVSLEMGKIRAEGEGGFRIVLDL